MTPAQAAAARRAAASSLPARRAPEVPAPPQVPLRVVERPLRRPSIVARRAVAGVSVLLIVASLLAVVVAHAMVDQGQIRLSGLQSRISGAEAAHASAQLKLAELQAPSAVVGQAERANQAAQAPATQVPSVPLSKPLGAPKVTGTTTPAAASPSQGSSATSSTSTSSTSSSASSASGASPSTTLPSVTGTAAGQ